MLEEFKPKDNTPLELGKAYENVCGEFSMLVFYFEKIQNIAQKSNLKDQELLFMDLFGSVLKEAVENLYLFTDCIYKGAFDEKEETEKKEEVTL